MPSSSSTLYYPFRSICAFGLAAFSVSVFPLIIPSTVFFLQSLFTRLFPFCFAVCSFHFRPRFGPVAHHLCFMRSFSSPHRFSSLVVFHARPGSFFGTPISHSFRPVCCQPTSPLLHSTPSACARLPGAPVVAFAGAPVVARSAFLPVTCSASCAWFIAPPSSCLPLLLFSCSLSCTVVRVTFRVSLQASLHTSDSTPWCCYPCRPFLLTSTFQVPARTTVRSYALTLLRFTTLPSSHGSGFPEHPLSLTVAGSSFAPGIYRYLLLYSRCMPSALCYIVPIVADFIFSSSSVQHCRLGHCCTVSFAFSHRHGLILEQPLPPPPCFFFTSL